MKPYKVYFEIYGKKMMKRVRAESIDDAKKKVISDMIFHKVEDYYENKNDILNDINDMINILSK